MCRITLVKEQRASGSFRPFVKMTLRQREGIIIGKKDMGTKNLMNYPEVFADIGNVNRKRLIDRRRPQYKHPITECSTLDTFTSIFKLA